MEMSAFVFSVYNSDSIVVKFGKNEETKFWFWLSENNFDCFESWITESDKNGLF